MIIYNYCKKSSCAITILRQEVGVEQCARKEEGRKEQPRSMKFWLRTDVLKVKLQYSVQPTQSQINGTETLSRAIAYTPPKIREVFKLAGAYPLMLLPPSTPPSATHSFNTTSPSSALQTHNGLPGPAQPH